ncbi:MAG TPA: ChaN family lipoprotein [Marivita sp.]|nr:ChaN family lipoprotein [Marivita sp.]
MKHIAVSLFLIAPTVLTAGGVFDGIDVVFLGELHDNADHHARQADYVSDLDPPALVFEMLTPEQAKLITPDLVADEDALEAALGWNESGWPDFSMYYPIFSAAPQASVYGAAVPRDRARAAMQDGMASAFRGDADRYGLTTPLDPDEQEDREALQLAAHCDAMPVEMLPTMVEIQRLRDAELAFAALDAFEAHGGPVVVITGNGHARLDWGAPVYVQAAAPSVTIAALGQGEDGRPAPAGQFDLIESSPPAKRGDPCDAFR